MKTSKRKALEQNGWKVGSTRDFLNLTAEEEAFIELKLRLSLFLQARRKKKRITQVQLASLIESSQSRVAKMEKAEESVSIDLIVKTLIALGATENDIARAIMRKP